MRAQKLSRGLMLVVAAFLLAPAPASATFHQWQLRELYTNSDGSAQFVEMFNFFNSEQFFAGPPAVQLISKNTGATLTNTYTFTSNSPFPTSNKYLLLATAGFDALPGGVTPDFIIPTDFLFAAGGSLELTNGFQSAFLFNHAALPTDGANAYLSDHTTAVNSPTNFAGQTGSVPEPAGMAVVLGTGAGFMLRRRRSR